MKNIYMYKFQIHIRTASLTTELAVDSSTRYSLTTEAHSQTTESNIHPR